MSTERLEIIKSAIEILYTSTKPGLHENLIFYHGRAAVCFLTFQHIDTSEMSLK